MAGTSLRGRARTEHDLWPSASDEHLLHAALDSGADARAAWERWLESGDADALRSRMRRTLPRVAANLRARGVDHPLFESADELQRFTAVRNRKLVATAAESVAALGAAGVEAMVLKGIVLVTQLGVDESMRAMSDIDLMVRPCDLIAACAALEQAGWTPLQRNRALHPFRCAVDHERGFDPTVPRQPEAGLPPDQKLDLHQYLTDYGSSPDAEAEVWERARPVELRGATALAQSATDLLLQACLGGLRPGRARNLRWVLDAHDVVNSERVDWSALLRQVELREVALPMQESLYYLRDEFRLAIPDTALQELRAMEVGAAQRWTYRVLTRYPRSLVQLAEECLARYRFGVRAQGCAAGALGFARFLRWMLEDAWELEGWSAILGRAWQRLARRTAPSRQTP